jgi:hypothetical protein
MGWTGRAAALVAAVSCGGVLFVSTAAAGAGSTAASNREDALAFDQRVIDSAMDKLLQKQKERATNPPATQPAQPTTQPVQATATQPTMPAWSTSIADPYGLQAVTARKLQMLREYDARVADARVAMRRHVLSSREVRRLVDERGALLSLPLDRLRTLVMEVDRQNADRFTRFRDAFGELERAGKTVSVVLMKSGRIDFATPLPEDPLTREIEQARGVRRTYYQFYLSPPGEQPRRYNGYIEFAYDGANGLWVPTWADFNGYPIPLFSAEAFVPLRPYDILYDGVKFVVAQAQPIRPPEFFSLLTPRWGDQNVMFAPRDAR